MSRDFDNTKNAELRAKMRTSTSHFSSALSSREYVPEYVRVRGRVRVRDRVSVSVTGLQLRRSQNEQ
jgi:hypothetical protein